MKFVLYGVMAAGLCSAANADLIEFNGQSSETVGWNTSSMLTNVGAGTVGGVGLTLETISNSPGMTESNGFGTDAAFDALNLSGGDVELVSMHDGADMDQSDVFGGLGDLGSLSSLSWMQDSRQGYDDVQATVVAPATVPSPATGLVLLLPAAMAGRRRRS